MPFNSRAPVMPGEDIVGSWVRHTGSAYCMNHRSIIYDRRNNDGRACDWLQLTQVRVLVFAQQG
jgi:hypothetical protein